MCILMTSSPVLNPARRIHARALLLGDRIDTAGLERADLVSTAPLAFHSGNSGFVVLFKFGVAVLFGLSPLEEDEVLARVGARVAGPTSRRDDETLELDLSGEGEEKSGRFAVKDMSAPELLVVADALAKSVALARDERRVNTVFDTIEPIAATLAEKGARLGGGARC